MMKASVVIKPAKISTSSNDKTTGKKSVVRKSATKNPATSSSAIPNLPPCIGCGCGTYMTPDTRALCCDKCEDREAWKCIDCLDMSQDAYDVLTTSACSSLKWFCDKCDRTTSLSKDEIKEDTLGDIIKVLEQLFDRTAVEQRLYSIKEKKKITTAGKCRFYR